jgi:hypothetical protein
MSIAAQPEDLTIAAVRAGRRVDADAALTLFDSLAPLGVDELRGRYRGSEIATGHPLDGALPASGWYGKQFDGPEEVHPLLFEANGRVFPVEPRYAAPGLSPRLPHAAVVAGRRLLPFARPVIEARAPGARIRAVEHRGVVGAAMVYDRLPVIDHFRRLGEGELLGLMDARNLRQPYFFRLRIM